MLAVMPRAVPTVPSVVVTPTTVRVVRRSGRRRLEAVCVNRVEGRRQAGTTPSRPSGQGVTACMQVVSSVCMIAIPKTIPMRR